MTERKFDRVPSRFHPKMLLHTVADVVADLLPRSYTWACDRWLDQGEEGACVGFGWAHDAAAKPAVWPGITNQTGFTDYERAKELDEYPGVDYDGTSVDAGAKVSRERGRISEWRWAKDAREVVLAIGHHGPVVFGVDWLRGMDDVDARGWIKAIGDVRGGHCLIGRGVRLYWLPGTTTMDRHAPDWWDHVDKDRSYVRLRNSWGRSWGLDGDALISVSDVQRLMDRGGEACLPVRLPVSRKR